MTRVAQPTQEALIKDFRQNVTYFEPNKYLTLGNGDSAHKVFFGAIPNLGDVAIKGHSHFQAAHGEKKTLQHAEARGLRTVEPLLVATGGLATYLVTRYRDDLSHLGQLDWRVGIADSRLHGVIKPTLATVASTLADWHNRNVTHGDAQLKNMTYTNDGQPVFLDAERSMFQPDGERFTKAANKDIQTVGRSAIRRGLLEDRSANYRVGFLQDELLAPYLEAVMTDKFTQSPMERRQVVANYWQNAIVDGPQHSKAA